MYKNISFFYILQLTNFPSCSTECVLQRDLSVFFPAKMYLFPRHRQVINLLERTTESCVKIVPTITPCEMSVPAARFCEVGDGVFTLPATG